MISLKKSILLSLQHLLAMIVGNVILALIVAGTTGLGVSDTTLLVQASFLLQVLQH